MNGRALRTLALVAFAAAACSNDYSGPLPPDSPAGAQLAWVISAINSADAGDSVGDIADHLTPALQDTLPAAGLLAAFVTIRGKQAPLVLHGFDGEITPTSFVGVVLDHNGRYVRIDIGTEAGEGGKLTRLAVDPAGDLDPDLDDWDKVGASLRAVAPDIGFLAAEVTSSGCAPIAVIDPDRELAIGSNFKLYVLSAIAKDIDQGKRHWSDAIPITEAYKSISPLEFEPDGTVHTLRDLTEQMIVHSDNTAADHLIFTLDRASVETAFVEAGNASPARNLPLLSTWDFFDIVLLRSPAEQQTYVNDDTALRRAYLARVPRTSDDRDAARTALTSWTAPRLLDTAGWFASANDLCRAVAHVQSFDKPPASDAIDILFESHGLPDLRGEWKRLGYKAGSEIGVLSVSYLMQRAKDGRTFFISLVMNDPVDDFDRDQAFYVLGAARGLLAR